MNATLTMQGDRLLLDCSDMHTPLAKQIPGMSYNRKQQTWACPLSPLAVDVAWDVFRGRLEVDAEVVKYMREVKAHVAHLNYLKDEQAGGILPSEIQEGLWPLQKSGVMFLSSAKHAFLCDDMGAGKTIQCYRALDDTQAYPALVVANKSALYTAWEAEGKKWCRSAEDIVVVDGSAVQRREALDMAREATASGRNVVVVEVDSCIVGCGSRS
jgi:SNF2 family DNA or RNA helicase